MDCDDEHFWGHVAVALYVVELNLYLPAAQAFIMPIFLLGPPMWHTVVDTSLRPIRLTFAYFSLGICSEHRLYRDPARFAVWSNSLVA